MAQRVRETADMEAFVVRVLRAISRRAVEGDVEAVETLNRLERMAGALLTCSVSALRSEPWHYSWADIGNALGVTKQAAQQRFGGRWGPEAL